MRVSPGANPTRDLNQFPPEAAPDAPEVRHRRDDAEQRQPTTPASDLFVAEEVVTRRPRNSVDDPERSGFLGEIRDRFAHDHVAVEVDASLVRFSREELEI